MLSMNMNTPLRQKGFTLVEIMVALVVGLIVIGGTIAMFASTAKTNSDSLALTHLDQELRATMNLMTRDLKRSGFWGVATQSILTTGTNDLSLSAKSGSGVTADIEEQLFDNIGSAVLPGLTIKHVDSGTAYTATVATYSDSDTITLNLTGTWPEDEIPAGTWLIRNPFAGITLTDESGDAVNDCITFNYDQDGDGVIDTANPDERFGYRWDDTNSTMEIRAGGAACTAGGWTDLNDTTSIEITDFQISASLAPTITVGQYTLAIQEFTFTLTGRLEGDATTSRTIRETVRVRNDTVL